MHLTTFSSWIKLVRHPKTPFSLRGSERLIFVSIADDGAAIQDALEEITSQRSVPNIFINKQHIGGNSDLQARKNELPQLLKDAGAL